MTHGESSVDRSKRGAGPLVVVGLLLLPVLYVLSIGPVIWLEDAGYLQGTVFEVLEVVYSPLAWLYENTPLGGPLAWYADLWD